jgi:beta-galactosidase
MSELEFVRKRSAFSVQETMNKLESLIKEKGITVFTKINHGENAKDVDLELNDSQVIIFGSPKVGTLMMKKNIFLSLDLPLKIAAVKDKSGDVWVVYNKTNLIKERYNLSDSEILKNVDKLMDNMTDLATK